MKKKQIHDFDAEVYGQMKKKILLLYHNLKSIRETASEFLKRNIVKLQNWLQIEGIQPECLCGKMFM